MRQYDGLASSNVSKIVDEQEAAGYRAAAAAAAPNGPKKPSLPAARQNFWTDPDQAPASESG
jgi:hypothetical protein